MSRLLCGSNLRLIYSLLRIRLRNSTHTVSHNPQYISPTKSILVYFTQALFYGYHNWLHSCLILLAEYS